MRSLRTCLRDRARCALLRSRELQKTEKHAELLARASWELCLARHDQLASWLVALVAPLAVAYYLLRGGALRNQTEYGRLMISLMLLGLPVEAVARAKHRRAGG